MGRMQASLEDAETWMEGRSRNPTSLSRASFEAVSFYESDDLTNIRM